MKLPDLHESVIDDATLMQLFDDLTTHATILLVRLKGQAERRADTGQVSLAQAKEALLTGGLRSMQVHYDYDGTEWRDTIIRMPSGWRVVRIDHGANVASGDSED